MLCVDCKAAGIEAEATRVKDGKGYCSSHSRKYFPPGAQMPPASSRLEEEAQAMKEKLEELIAQGKTTAEIAEALGKTKSATYGLLEYYKLKANRKICSVAGCCKPLQNSNDTGMCAPHSRKSGAEPAARLPRVPAKRAAAAAQAVTAIAVAPAASVEMVPPAAPSSAAARARCRVAMFEVEGDAAAVQSAVEAVKAALMRGAQG